MKFYFKSLCCQIKKKLLETSALDNSHFTDKREAKLLKDERRKPDYIPVSTQIVIRTPLAHCLCTWPSHATELCQDMPTGHLLTLLSLEAGWNDAEVLT